MKHWFTLADVCERIDYGVTASAVVIADGPRLLRITDITDVGVDWKSVPGCHISRQEYLSSKLNTGDIVVARTGGTVGKSFLVSDPPDAVCASYLLRLRPNASVILPAYLDLFLKSDSYWFQLIAAAQGAAQPNVNGTTLSQIALHVPSLEHQDHVVRIYQYRLSLVAKAAYSAAIQLKEMNNLSQSIIFRSLQGLREGTVSLYNALEEVKDGIGSKWASFPVLGATRGGLAPAKESPGKLPHRYKPVFPGTVFYNPMRILIGSIAFVGDDDEPGITSPDYVVLKGKPGIVDSRWFYYWLKSPLGEQCISSLARGAVRERMLFNRLAEGEIDLPDYATQQKASRALAKIKPMRTALENQMTELKAMPGKLLAQFFENAPCPQP